MAIGSSLPFRPAGTASVAGSTSAASTTLTGGGSSVLVFNAAAATAFVKFGVEGMDPASASDLPIPPGARMLVDAGRLVTEASALLAAGTGAVYFTRGDGSVY